MDPWWAIFHANLDINAQCVSSKINRSQMNANNSNNLLLGCDGFPISHKFLFEIARNFQFDFLIYRVIIFLETKLCINPPSLGCTDHPIPSRLVPWNYRINSIIHLPFVSFAFAFALFIIYEPSTNYQPSTIDQPSTNQQPSIYWWIYPFLFLFLSFFHWHSFSHPLSFWDFLVISNSLRFSLTLFQQQSTHPIWFIQATVNHSMTWVSKPTQPNQHRDTFCSILCNV